MLTSLDNLPDDCGRCETSGGICEKHARWIGDISQVDWKKLQGTSLLLELTDEEIQRQEHEKQKAEESRALRQSLAAPKPSAITRLAIASTGRHTGRRNRQRKAA